MPEYIVEWLRFYDAALEELHECAIGEATLAWEMLTHRFTPEQRIAAWEADVRRRMAQSVDRLAPFDFRPTPRQQRRWSLCRCEQCFSASLRVMVEEGLDG